MIPDTVANELINKKFTQDSLYDGHLQCWQAAEGYRFSIDSVLISHFADIKKNDKVLDLGTGCGIIMLILLYRSMSKICEIVGVEIQHDLATLAKKNLQINGLANKGKIIEGDIKNLSALICPESFDMVVCNPPFYGKATGRQSSNREACFARHQILAELDDFFRATSLAIKNKGIASFIYPAGQVASFMKSIEKHRLEVKKLRFVYSYPHTKQDARLVLIECCKNGGSGCHVLPPLYIYQRKNSVLSEELKEYYKKIKED